MSPSSQKQPAQSQADQPGHQDQMVPEPVSIDERYVGANRLRGRVAIITGGDSGIGRAVALHYAREGADVVIGYLDEDRDARECERLVRAEGARCVLVRGDVGKLDVCQALVRKAVEEFGKLDILVNNAAEQHPVEEPEELTEAQIERTFRTNIFAYMFMAKSALPYMGEGASIINTGSVTGVRGHETLLDYAATKGAIHAFTFSLAQALADRRIRVNAVAPGPIWTPLIPASFKPEEVAKFGANTLMKRAGQPSEVAPAYVFLACNDASFITGQTIHVNGGGFISA